MHTPAVLDPPSPSHRPTDLFFRSAPTLRWLPKLLALVRWHLIDSKERPKVLKRLAEEERRCIASLPLEVRIILSDYDGLTSVATSAATSNASSAGSEASSPPYAEERAALERHGSQQCGKCLCNAEEPPPSASMVNEASDMQDGVTLPGIGGKEALQSQTPHCMPGLVRLVQTLWQLDESTGSQLPAPRVRLWGHLEATGGQPPQPMELSEWELVCTKEYMVGRSRKSDIRIGHTSPMPYISGQHFRLFHRLGWSSIVRYAEQTERSQQTGEAATAVHAAGEAGADACSRSVGNGDAQQVSLQHESLQSNKRLEAAKNSPSLVHCDFSRPGPSDLGPPQLEAWLEDLSQNGTFVNGVLVGKGLRRRLRNRDSIELVFPVVTQQTQQLPVAFPSFTFYSTQPKLMEVAVQTESHY